MSFIAKLLIFFGWMMIFSKGIKMETSGFPDSCPNLVEIFGRPFGIPRYHTKMGSIGAKKTVGSDDIYFQAEDFKNHVRRLLSHTFDPVDITELDEEMIHILAEIGKHEKTKMVISRFIRFGRELERLTSGGPAAAYPPMVLFCSIIVIIIGSVALLLVLLRE